MRSNAIIAILIAYFAFSIPAQADPSAQARKTIQALYNKKNAAVARQDLVTAVSVYADEFSSVDQDGVISPTTRDDKLRLYNKMVHTDQPGVRKSTVKERDTVVSAKPISGGIVVVEKGDYTFTMFGENSKVLKQHVVGTFREFWAKKGDTYLLTQSRILSIHKSAFLDGEPVKAPPEPTP
ncbi:MAG: hypothetical protein ABIY70_27620 [Capsulimonas sp.]|uniref:hypothetical protein n=1 Tax=Capsulimonas sp. TaxID=2494211 RepID=UPI00326412DA